MDAGIKVTTACLCSVATYVTKFTFAISTDAISVESLIKSSASKSSWKVVTTLVWKLQSQSPVLLLPPTQLLLERMVITRSASQRSTKSATSDPSHCTKLAVTAQHQKLSGIIAQLETKYLKISLPPKTDYRFPRTRCKSVSSLSTTNRRTAAWQLPLCYWMGGAHIGFSKAGYSTPLSLLCVIPRNVSWRACLHLIFSEVVGKKSDEKNGCFALTTLVAV